MNEELQQLTSQERLRTYELFIRGCTHLWGRDEETLKRGFKVAKAGEVLNTLIPLTTKDPYFLAHLTSYIMRKDMGKDLKVFTTYVNSLSTADGQPFSVGSDYNKPNLRIVSFAALQQLDPILAGRVLEVASTKFSVTDYLNYGRHFSSSLRTAFKKYLRYREANLQMLKGIKRAGLSHRMESLYRTMRIAPSDEAAALIHYRQKGKKIKFADSLFDFSGLDDLGIATKIRQEKLPVLPALGALPRKVSPVIAVALLEQATGNQAVILKGLFEEAGVLKDKEVMDLFQEKLATAKGSLDRVETLSKGSSLEVEKVMKQARADKRKEQLTDVGKVFLHIDTSPSMDSALEVAMKRGAIIAEMIPDPEHNFQWGLFHGRGEILPLPQTFEEDAFRAILFGKTTQSSTNAFALYPHARQFGADVDVLISDGDHNVGNLETSIRAFHEQNPQLPKPKAMVLVWIKNGYSQDTVKEAYEANGIPVAVVDPDTITSSAWVMQAIRSAMLGAVAQVDEIMNTPLLTLPEWYFSI